MTEPPPTPLESVRLGLYRVLRGTAAARGDPAMAALALEVGVLEAIAALDAILTPVPPPRAAKGGARRGPGACREARARKAAETA